MALIGGPRRAGPDQFAAAIPRSTLIPLPEQASDYYSMPQLAVAGSVVRNGKREAMTGRAWLDREWSSSYLPPWDWTGVNLMTAPP